MKKLILLLFLSISLSLSAQIQTPAPSTFCKIEQKFGLGTISIEYSRPSMKNRKVFGELVDYNTLWRTGANKATKITFTDDVMIEGKSLPKGSYALYSIPGELSWDLIFYSDWDQPGTPKNYDISKEAIRVQAIPELLTTSIETFTIDINDIKNDEATLNIKWENTGIAVKIKTDVDSKVVKSIEKVLAGPSSDDFFLAARYYFDSGKDLNTALGWIQKANTMDPKYWKLRIESLILAKLGRRTEAVEVAQRSKALAAADGNEDYVKMNNESIAEWSRN
ncbi:MAG: DUF2911 domain-containing protein [Saprospiraceae bacterium]|nr:DUF2911 domain-containing protein [Candidatus Vicinibacter proximus]